ncbi:MAG: hopanoid biosynthesis associated radical SAM protein HpnJ [Candidatus Omnitrophica bacterium]|nr:hopanoid biosynthesis associated radical SAM protein HpnJ [Candidatus Omnitrophota bacterium]
MKTLLLNPPSFENFDAGASSRWPSTREVWSFWYPVWLAYPAAMIPNSRLLDASPHGVTPEETVRIAAEYEFIVLFTSTTGFHSDVKLAERMKASKPSLKIAFVGPHVSVEPEKSLMSSPAIDFVTYKEFDYAVRDFAAGKPLDEIPGVTFRKNGHFVATPPPPQTTDLDAIPWVTPIYKRDLDVTKYNIPFLLHPYISLYTTRGCPALCTFCLWPQTLDDHPWRERSVENTVEEVKFTLKNFPQVREIFFDDDTFTIRKDRVLALCEKFKPLKFTWSCNSRVHVDYETLKAMREAGCRLFITGFESGDPQILKNIKKGTTVEQAKTYMKNCKRVGIKVHGDFIIGLPGETPETIERTIQFAKDLDPETIQVSIAHAFPGTDLYRYVTENGFFRPQAEMTDGKGHQLPHIEYPGLPQEAMMEAVDRFYAEYYLRPRVIWRIVKKALFDSRERRRLVQEAREYLRLHSDRIQFIRRKRGLKAA